MVVQGCENTLAVLLGSTTVISSVTRYCLSRNVLQAYVGTLQSKRGRKKFKS